MRRRMFVGFVVSKVATIVTVRIQKPIASRRSKRYELDAEEIGVRIVLRSAAFPPTGHHGRLAGGKGICQSLALEH
jgi:hypothetical protein